MFSDDRNAYRQMFFVTWDKHKKKLPLEPMEAQVLDIILAHPEYHDILEQPKKFANQEFEIEENPFFHMSLHISLREQVSTNRPSGIKQVYKNLVEKFKNQHIAEHKMTTVLAQVMQAAQQSGKMPDASEYLERLRKL